VCMSEVTLTVINVQLTDPYRFIWRIRARLEYVGIADVVFGAVNPSGRLPFTIPASVDQLPPITDYSMTGGSGRMCCPIVSSIWLHS
jgi:hypothetical protein